MRCNALLFERRLNANYYAPENRTIWHVLGFCEFRYRCSDTIVARVPTALKRRNIHTQVISDSNKQGSGRP